MDDIETLKGDLLNAAAGAGSLAALDLKLTDAQIAALDEVSKPALNFPADLNRDLSPSFAFAGATVDGQRTAVLPLLSENAPRY